MISNFQNVSVNVTLYPIEKSSDQNVYVNVTWCHIETSKQSNSQNVYVNVTLYPIENQVLKMFMWMLHYIL
jgi:hypothetical protein